MGPQYRDRWCGIQDSVVGMRPPACRSDGRTNVKERLNCPTVAVYPLLFDRPARHDFAGRALMNAVGRVPRSAGKGGNQGVEGRDGMTTCQTRFRGRTAPSDGREFTDRVTSQRTRNPALLAAALADGTNLSPLGMADASHGLSHRHLVNILRGGLPPHDPSAPAAKPEAAAKQLGPARPRRRPGRGGRAGGMRGAA
jgi:hypothetical protein